MKLVYASSLIASAYAASWGYDTQPWTSGYCKPAEYVRQSPIDIVTKDVNVKPVSEDTEIGASTFVQNHFVDANYTVNLNQIDSLSAHSVTFSFAEEIGNDKFACPQFHCHFADSEHSVDDKKTFGECHTVCYNKEVYGSFGNSLKTINGDELAVFGFFIEEEAHSAGSDAVWSWIDAKNGFNTTNDEVAVQIAVPDNLDKYYRYEGGLTTPGCNPIVQWTVFADTVKISTAQKLEILSWSSGHLIGNNREVQPMQGREVTCFGCEDDSYDNDDDCENKKFVIRSDGSIRPSQNEDMCAAVENRNGDVKNKAKLKWVPCDAADSDAVNTAWRFVENESDEEHEDCGFIVSEDSDSFAWSIKNLNRAQNQNVHMTAKRDMDRQMFVFRHGMIWLFHENSDGQKYCVSYEGPGSKLKTRRCWEPLAGEFGDDSPAME